MRLLGPDEFSDSTGYVSGAGLGEHSPVVVLLGDLLWPVAVKVAYAKMLTQSEASNACAWDWKVVPPKTIGRVCAQMAPPYVMALVLRPPSRACVLVSYEELGIFKALNPGLFGRG